MSSRGASPGTVGAGGGDRPAHHLRRASAFLEGVGEGRQINTDRNLRLQYLAGMWLNSNMGEQILSTILAHYRFPDQTFVGSPEAIDALKQGLDEEGRKAPVVRP